MFRHISQTYRNHHMNLLKCCTNASIRAWRDRRKRRRGGARNRLGKGSGQWPERTARTGNVFPKSPSDAGIHRQESSTWPRCARGHARPGQSGSVCDGLSAQGPGRDSAIRLRPVHALDSGHPGPGRHLADWQSPRACRRVAGSIVGAVKARLVRFGMGAGSSMFRLRHAAGGSGKWIRRVGRRSTVVPGA